MSGSDAAHQPSTLFRSVRVFDGGSGSLSEAMDVLVRGTTIESISPPSNARTDEVGTVVLDGGGRTLMPGLIDAHWHTFLAPMSLAVFLNADIGYLNHVAAHEAERTLMRGFTTVRDAGGPCFGLKRAHTRSGVEDGNRRQRCAARRLGTAQPLPRQARTTPVARGSIVATTTTADKADL